MLESFFLLLLFQLAGTVLQSLLHVPIPGPVIGMALLAAWLLWRKDAAVQRMAKVADPLLAWFGLLFVPAGVGIVANLALLRQAWLAVLIGLAGSTLLTVFVTAGVMSLLARRLPPKTAE